MPAVPEDAVQSAAQQEHGLAGITDDLQPAGISRLGQRRKVDPCRDVLQTGPEEWIIVCPVPVMAHQGAVRPLRQIVLAARVSVVD